jgi:hypothetical protein
MATNTPYDHRRTSWHFRVAGFFWLFVGLIAAVLLTINHWNDLATGDGVRLVSVVLICCLLAFSGYGLSKETIWGKIGCGVLVSVLMLFLSDMALMFAVHKHFAGLLPCAAGLLMGLYTVYLIIFVRKRPE